MTAVFDRRRPSPFLTLCLVVTALVLAVVCYPLLRMVSREFLADGELNTAAFVRVWRSPGLVRTLVNTMVVVGVGTVVATVVGSTFAWFNERTDARLGWAANLLPILPMMVPPIAGAIGWTLLASPGAGLLNGWIRDAAGWVGIDLGDRGPLEVASWQGLIFLYSVYLVPQVYLLVAAALRNLDPALEEAARSSGSPPFRTLLTVTLPSVRPAILAGAMLAVIYGVSMFSIPAIVGAPADIEVLSARIVRLLTFSFPPSISDAMVLGILVVLVIGVMSWINGRVLRQARHATIGGRGAKVSMVSLGRWRHVARALMLLYLLATSVLPFAALVLVSLQSFWTRDVKWDTLNLDAYRSVLFETEMTQAALRNSLMLGVLTASVGMLVASMLVYLTRQGRSPSMSRLVDLATKVPAGLSHVVIAAALLAALAGAPFNLHGTVTLLFIAFFVMYLPQASTSAASAEGQVGRDLTEASLVSGAGHGRTFGRIMLPLMAPGITAGWAFVFVMAVGDITASAILSGTDNPVAGFVVLELFQSGTYPRLAALAVVFSIACSGVVLSFLRLSSLVQRRTEHTEPRRVPPVGVGA